MTRGAVGGASGGVGVQPRTTAPVLHLPDEPVVRRDAWREAVLDGRAIADVVGGPDGVAQWLWARWSVLGAAGMDEAALTAVVRGYRRELWLWMVGDRTWAQCCGGLVGRITRRLPS